MSDTIGVLGSTGFVGQNVIEKFKEYNIDYVGGSRKLGVDARNVASIADWIYENNIDIVINLAALCGGIGANKNSSADFWAATTQISYAVLESARITKLKKLINLGTVCSYAADCPTPFKEEYLLNFGPMERTNLAYGMAKLNYLFGAQAYKKQYGINTVNIVPVNMYGKYDHFDLENSHVIPAMIRKFIDAKHDGVNRVVLWGDGTPTREFLYGGDFAEAVVKIIDNCDTDEFINIGSGNEISMKDLASTIATLVDFKGEIIWNSAMPNGQMKRCLDVSKAKEKFGFTAQTSLHDGLKQTIDWFIKSK